MRHARSFLGVDDGQSQMMAERSGGRACVECNKRRIITFTALVPVVRGHSRPRITEQRHPQATVCYRCVIRAMLRVLFARAGK